MENLGQGLGSVGKAHAFCISFIYDVLGKFFAILELKLTKIYISDVVQIIQSLFKVGAELSQLNLLFKNKEMPSIN